eukprot:1995283-Amphidinium_carterae.1
MPLGYVAVSWVDAHECVANAVAMDVEVGAEMHSRSELTFYWQNRSMCRSCCCQPDPSLLRPMPALLAQRSGGA